MLLLEDICLALIFLTCNVQARIYFTETFDDAGIVGEGVYERWQKAEVRRLEAVPTQG